MELMIFIVAIALAYHYMVRKPKQRKLDAELQEAEYMDISQKESAKRSLQDAIAFTGAVQRIAKAKQCKISPLTIQAIKDDNNYFVHLDMEFTVYNIQTTPFYDLKVRHLIAEGKEHPKYTQISQDDLQRLDTGRKNILKDSSLYAKATDKIRLLVNDSCNHAICLQLFGEAQNYFNYHIDQYDTDISQYPIGNITIRSNWNYFDVGKYNTYKRFFSYIVSCLQTQFPDATIVSYSTEAKISF